MGGVPQKDMMEQVADITYESMRRQGEKFKHAAKKTRAMMRECCPENYCPEFVRFWGTKKADLGRFKKRGFTV